MYKLAHLRSHGFTESRYITAYTVLQAVVL